MKKLLITFALLLSFTSVSLAQIEAAQPTENLIVENETPQIEFYSSVETFYMENPSFFMHLIAFIIAQEVYEQMRNKALPVKTEVVSL